MATFHKIFVYGTLKRNEPNHGWFTKSKEGQFKFLFEAQTVEKFPLIIQTKYNIPFLLYSPGNGSNVKGELYEVDDKVLADLDVLEDHPNFYVREQHEIQPSNGSGEIVKAWIYFIKNFKKDLLQKTMYEKYSNYDSHGLKYTEKYLRQEIYSPKSEILFNSSENANLDDLNSN